jgi:DNA-binding LytR/AlgR family response regulator
MTEPLPINCLIVDDEPNAIHIIEDYIQDTPGFTVAGAAGNAMEAYHLLRSQKIDLLFLDIQMPVISGFQLLKNLDHPPVVIITTAHRDYAVEAFDFDVLDYLLKPISPERFNKAVNRFRENFSEQGSAPDHRLPGESILTVRSNRREIRLTTAEILYLEARGDYVAIHTVKGEKHLTLGTLTGLFKRLPGKEFARIHRAYVVNRRHIRAIGSKTVEVGKSILPLSRGYRPIS